MWRHISLGETAALGRAGSAVTGEASRTISAG
jgi:hypothetical protein